MGCATRYKQASDDRKQTASDVLKVGCCKETNNLCPHDLSERSNSFLKPLCACQFLLTLVYGKKSGNASNGNAQKRWSPPGIACEPILPTPSMMRADRTRWTRWSKNMLRNFRQRKHLDVLPAPVRYPCATKCSTSHIHSSYRCEKMKILLERRRWREKTADCTHSTSTIAFGFSSQTLLPECTVWTIRLGGDVDGPLRVGVFLTNFAQPEACSRWTA